MRHHRLFAAGLAAAMLLGVATPAMAKQPDHGNKGNPPGHSDTKPGKGPKPADPPKPPKPPKAKNGGVSGGGSIAAGTFSIHARTDRFAKGHFNYTSTDEKFKVRCRDFDPATDSVTITGNTAVLKAKCTTLAPKRSGKDIWVEATFEDNGDPAKDATATATPAPKDKVTFKYFNTNDYTAAPAEQYTGELTGGNVKVR